MEPGSVITSSAEEGQVLDSIDKSYLVAPQPQQNSQHISSQFHDALRLDSLAQSSEETKEKNVITLTNHGLEGQGLTTEQASSDANASLSENPIHPVNFSETMVNNASGSDLPEAFVSSGQKNTYLVGKTPEITLLDERSLLACIVRTIPPGSGGRIRISSTLPNRLGKMLAPLHWHDYKKKYGKLDDFVAVHPELFVIEGDYIQLREVTPMAQSHRLKRAPSIDSNSMRTDKTIFKEFVVSTPANATDNPSLPEMQNQHSNGVCFNIAGGISNVKILSKPKDPVELNGPENPSRLLGMQNQHSNGVCFNIAGGISNIELVWAVLKARDPLIKGLAQILLGNSKPGQPGLQRLLEDRERGFC
ncbi:hypothetical protein F0562_031016 [Nyssa sinensis]|uniref:DUF7725 domain-containing protein n=1 Tax=Nyssa sinensis TaxID=561372 RepID=A0A5J5ASI3_9ASTE|nr:hypothetical protein F0562_031016 [Nyssa sinensis]